MTTLVVNARPEKQSVKADGKEQSAPNAILMRPWAPQKFLRIEQKIELQNWQV